MTQSTPQAIAQLRKCIALAQEVANHPQANQAFEQWQGQHRPRKFHAAELMDVLWQEAIAARRSAEFWQDMSNVEKNMCDQMMENMT